MRAPPPSSPNLPPFPPNFHNTRKPQSSPKLAASPKTSRTSQNFPRAPKLPPSPPKLGPSQTTCVSLMPATPPVTSQKGLICPLSPNLPALPPSCLHLPHVRIPPNCPHPPKASHIFPKSLSSSSCPHPPNTSCIPQSTSILPVSPHTPPPKTSHTPQSAYSPRAALGMGCCPALCPLGALHVLVCTRCARLCARTRMCVQCVVCLCACSVCAHVQLCSALLHPSSMPRTEPSGLCGAEGSLLWLQAGGKQD